MNNRQKWLSDIYLDMTGALPPDVFWDTYSGQMIAENNSTYLYDHPTANLYQIIKELKPDDRAEVIRLIRSQDRTLDRQALNGMKSEKDEESFLARAITRSALRVASYIDNEMPSLEKDSRYRIKANHNLKRELQKCLREQYTGIRNGCSFMMKRTWKEEEKTRSMERNQEKLHV